MNECGEIYPTVNTNARAPTISELNVAMETFAAGLRSGLRMGACGNDLVLLYSKTYGRVSGVSSVRKRLVFSLSPLQRTV